MVDEICSEFGGTKENSKTKYGRRTPMTIRARKFQSAGVVWIDEKMIPCKIQGTQNAKGTKFAVEENECKHGGKTENSKGPTPQKKQLATKAHESGNCSYNADRWKGDVV